VVLGKDGEDQLDRSCGKCRVVTQSQGGKEHPTYNKKKDANWIGHILCRNYLLKHVNEGKIGGRIEVTKRRGRIRKQLLDDLMEIEGGSTRSHSVETSLYKKLCTCRNTN
jgi:hypothetical protein